MLLHFLVSTLWVVALAERKNLSPSENKGGLRRNRNTLELVFDAPCLEINGQTAEEAIQSVLDDYKCLTRNRKFPQKIFDSPNFRWTYVDFVGSDVALRKCVDKETDMTCLLSSEYEMIADAFALDYASDTCLGVTDTVSNDIWSLDYWDGVFGDDQYQYNGFTPFPNRVDIYILDNGVDDDHPEFQMGGTSRVHEIDPSDPGHYGTHGTHVAGTAAGKSTGVTGENFDIYNCHACQAWEECFYWSYISERATQIRDRSQSEYTKGRRGVVNMSFGGDLTGFSRREMRQIVNPINGIFSQIQSYGTILVAAAGNDLLNAATYWPCNVAGVICVGAFDRNLEATYFSNYGNTVDVWAPGRDIYSAVPDGGYERWDGTSMAAPHVAGEVANILQRDTNNELMTGADVIAVLTDHRRSVEITGYAGLSGQGGIGVMGQCGAFPPTTVPPIQTGPGEPVVPTVPETNPFGCCWGNAGPCKEVQTVEDGCNWKCTWTQGVQCSDL